MSALAKIPMVDPSVTTGPQFDNRRMAAALIDLLIPVAMAAAAYAAGLSLTRGVVLVVAGWTLYYFFALESGDGQTLGKRVMKLRVVSADGGPATMQQVAKRTVVRIVDGNIIGLIVMLATGDRRMRLGDIVAGTVVTEAESTPAATEAPTTAMPAPPDPVDRPRRGAPRPSVARRSLPKPSLSLPSLRRRRGLSAQARAAQVRAVPAPFAPSDLAEPAPEKVPFHKRPISLPSFGRKPKAPSAGEMSLTRGPGPAAAPAQGATPPPPTFESLVQPEPAPADPAQGDRLSDALRASDPHEAESLEAFAEEEPSHDEPVVELDHPAPEVSFDAPEPVVEYDRDEPDPLADLGGDREPTVEVDAPQSLPDSQAELEPWAEPLVHAHEPVAEPEPEPQEQDPPADGDDSDPDMTIKPIETVSAIDLVMQDAERRPPRGD